MAYLSSLVSSVSNVITSTASVASAYASGTGSNSEVTAFLTKYKLLDKVTLSSTSPLASIYVVYDAIKKDEQTPVTLFIHADSNYPNSFAPELGTSAFELSSSCARNALRRLRTLRHPDVLAYKDGVASPNPNGPVYIVTERARPLGCPPALGSNITEPSKAQKELLISWGLLRVASAVEFLKSCSFIHGLLQADCIFVNLGLEWKLGGFDLLHSTTPNPETESQDTAEVGFLKGLSLFSGSRHLRPPSMEEGSFDPYIDFWQFGCLLYEVLTGKSFDLSRALPPPPEIPKSLHPVYKRLLSTDTKAKLKDLKKVLSNSFFNNSLVQVNQFLDELAVKDIDSRKDFFSNLVEQASDFPPPIIRYKLLPQLCTAVEFGSGGAEALSSIMKLGGSLEAGEFSIVAVPPLLRAFKSSDRQMRLLLLGHLPQLAPHLSNDQINSDLFPSIINGCSDLAPQLKEATIRGLVSLVDRLSQRNINQDLFKQLQTLQFDAHPAVRTNALIGIGRIASLLDSHLRGTKLAPLLIQSLRDPFPPARQACLRALAVIATHVDPSVICNKILPSLCPLILDPELSVRSAAHPAIDTLLRVAKAAAAELPEKKPTPVNTPGDSASPSQINKDDPGWTGWAVTSLSKTLTSAVQNYSTTEVASPEVKPDSPSLSIAISREDKSNPTPHNTPTVVHQTSSLSLKNLKKATKPPPKKPLVIDDTNDEEDAWGTWGDEFDNDTSKEKDTWDNNSNDNDATEENDAWGDDFNADGAAKEGDAWGNNFDTNVTVKGDNRSTNSNASPLSKSKKSSTPTTALSPPSSQTSIETPAQKREAYRQQLEARRQQRQSNPNSRPTSSSQKSSRGMALKSKQQP